MPSATGRVNREAIARDNVDGVLAAQADRAVAVTEPHKVQLVGLTCSGKIDSGARLGGETGTGKDNGTGMGTGK